MGRVTAQVIAVCINAQHTFSKQQCDSIELIAGYGVRGDAHAGKTVQHLSRVKVDPYAPNLRQVHLIHEELFSELAHHGYNIQPGDLGENITTSGINLLSLSEGTQLHLGSGAVVEITGLRNPCKQIENFRTGLLECVVSRDGERIFRQTGVMGIVRKGEIVKPGDTIQIPNTPAPHIPLNVV